MCIVSIIEVNHYPVSPCVLSKRHSKPVRPLYENELLYIQVTSEVNNTTHAMPPAPISTTYTTWKERLPSKGLIVASLQFQALYMERTITRKCLNRSFLRNFQTLHLERTITKQSFNRNFLKNFQVLTYGKSDYQAISQL